MTNLAGNTQQGDTVTATFTVPSGMNDQLTLVSYIAPGSTFSNSTAYQQVIYQQATGTYTPGTHSMTVKIPKQRLPDRLRLRPGDQPAGAEPKQ